LARLPEQKLATATMPFTCGAGLRRGHQSCLAGGGANRHHAAVKCEPEQPEVSAQDPEGRVSLVVGYVWRGWSWGCPVGRTGDAEPALPPTLTWAWRGVASRAPRDGARPSCVHRDGWRGGPAGECGTSDGLRRAQVLVDGSDEPRSRGWSTRRGRPDAERGERRERRGAPPPRRALGRAPARKLSARPVVARGGCSRASWRAVSGVPGTSWSERRWQCLEHQGLHPSRCARSSAGARGSRKQRGSSWSPAASCEIALEGPHQCDQAGSQPLSLTPRAQERHSRRRGPDAPGGEVGWVREGAPRAS
jgi:hypothetical protein